MTQPLVIYQYANPEHSVIKDSRGNFIPVNPDSRQYQEFLKNHDLSEVRVYTAPKVDLNAYLAAVRYKFETGGIYINGMFVATDDRSKTMIIGARAMADTNKDYVLKWKLGNGNFINLDAGTIIYISNTVLQHVQKCFDIEGDISDLISKKEIRTVEQIDQLFKEKLEKGA